MRRTSWPKANREAIAKRRSRSRTRRRWRLRLRQSGRPISAASLAEAVLPRKAREAFGRLTSIHDSSALALEAVGAGLAALRARTRLRQRGKRDLAVVRAHLLQRRLVRPRQRILYPPTLSPEGRGGIRDILRTFLSPVGRGLG